MKPCGDIREASPPNSGVVDEGVEVAKLFLHEVAGLRERGDISDVELHSREAARSAVAVFCFDFCFRGFGFGEGPGCYDDMVVGGCRRGENLGGGQTDARVGASDL